MSSAFCTLNVPITVERQVQPRRPTRPRSERLHTSGDVGAMSNKLRFPRVDPCDASGDWTLASSTIAANARRRTSLGFRAHCGTSRGSWSRRIFVARAHSIREPRTVDPDPCVCGWARAIEMRREDTKGRVGHAGTRICRCRPRRHECERADPYDIPPHRCSMRCMQRLGIVVLVCGVGCNATSAPPSENAQLVVPTVVSSSAPARPAARRAAGEVTISRLASVGYYASSGADAGDVYVPFKHEAVQACYAAALRGSPAMVGWLIVTCRSWHLGRFARSSPSSQRGSPMCLFLALDCECSRCRASRNGLLEVPVYMRFR